MALKPGDRLMLSSDGLHGPVSETVIAERLGRSLTLEAIGASLVEAALGAGGSDDITVVLCATDLSRM